MVDARTTPGGRIGRGTVGLWFRSAAVQWMILALLAIVAVVLGHLGYQEHFRATRRPYRLTDLLYLDLKLFAFGGEFGSQRLPWTLEVARFLAPAVGAYSALKALGTLFRDRVDHVRAQFRRDHVVIIGAGDLGATLARTLVDAGHRVVVLDVDEAACRRAMLRKAGCNTTTGDGRRVEALAGVAVHRAATVVALTGDSAVNAEIAMRVGELTHGSGRAATCLVRIDDPDLCRLVRLHELRRNRPGVRLDFISLGEAAVRRVLREIGGASPVWLIGRGELVERIAGALDRRSGPEGRVYVHAEVSDGTHPDAAVAVVSQPTDAETLEAALAVRDLLPSTAMIVAVFDRPGGLSRLVDEGGAGATIVAIDLVAPLTSVDAMRPATIEELARAIHDAYRTAREEAGDRSPDDPSMAGWDALSEHLRESNRQQAATIVRRLEGIGATVVPLASSVPDEFSFTAGEVEDLARAEHARWAAERRTLGWTPGPRDAGGSTSPHLVDWDDLDEATRELDRDAIRAIPEVLAAAGLRPVRLQHRPDASG